MKLNAFTAIASGCCILFFWISIALTVGLVAMSDSHDTDTSPPHQDSSQGVKWYSTRMGECVFKNVTNTSLTFTFAPERTQLFARPPDGQIVDVTEETKVVNNSILTVSSLFAFTSYIENGIDTIEENTLSVTKLADYRKPDCDPVKLPQNLVPNATYFHNFSEFLTTYNNGIDNNRCRPWDLSYTVDCTTDYKDWCPADYYYVNSKCDGAAPSAYFPNQNIYYSYDVCADSITSNSWTELYPKTCFLFETPSTGVNALGNGKCDVVNGKVTINWDRLTYFHMHNSTIITEGSFAEEVINKLHGMYIGVKIGSEIIIATLQNSTNNLDKLESHALGVYSNSLTTFYNPYNVNNSVNGEYCTVAVDEGAMSLFYGFFNLNLLFGGRQGVVGI